MKKSRFQPTAQSSSRAGDKVEYWRASRREIVSQAAPVLVFLQFTVGQDRPSSAAVE